MLRASPTVTDIFDLRNLICAPDDAASRHKPTTCVLQYCAKVTWESGSRTLLVVASPGAPKSRGQQTQARLLAAAVDVFESNGYHSTRVDDIVKAACTSHGTFYLYFANKEALFLTLMTTVSEEFRDLARSLPAIDLTTSNAAPLRDWIEQFGDLYKRRAPIVRVWTEIEIAGNDIAAQGEALLTNFVVALAEQILGMWPIPPSDATLTASIIMAMIERSYYYRLARAVPADDEALLDALASATFAILTAPR